MRLLFSFIFIFVLCFQPLVYAIEPGPWFGCCKDLEEHGEMSDFCNELDYKGIKYNFTKSVCDEMFVEWEQAEADWYASNRAIFNNPMEFVIVLVGIVLAIIISIYFIIKRRK